MRGKHSIKDITASFPPRDVGVTISSTDYRVQAETVNWAKTVGASCWPAPPTPPAHLIRQLRFSIKLFLSLLEKPFYGIPLAAGRVLVSEPREYPFCRMLVEGSHFRTAVSLTLLKPRGTVTFWSRPT